MLEKNTTTLEMSQEKIIQLTPKQEALIPLYWEKWRSVVFSTERIDREKASEAVKAFYTAIGDPEPESIIFFDSPYAALSNFEQWEKLIGSYKLYSWDYFIEVKLWSPCETIMSSAINLHNFGDFILRLKHKYDEGGTIIQDQLFGTLYEQLLEYMERIEDQEWKQNNTCQLSLEQFLYIAPESLVIYIILASVLNYAYNQQTLKALQSIVSYCGWIFPFEKICIVCDRPIKLSVDIENRLHAEGEPAIQFGDGYSLYSYHGVTLPEKYGKLQPHQWQAQWLLEEDNAELRAVLIQGIGYARICRELQVTELDAWQEYTLLKIDSNPAIEPIHLLKMTFSNTKYIYTLYISPDVESAREAVRWISSWGVDLDDGESLQKSFLCRPEFLVEVEEKRESISMTSTGLRSWTVDEYHRMIEAGILTNDDRVELIAGQIIQMSPQRPLHAATIQCASDYLRDLLSDKATIRVQSPITLPPNSEPEPDIAVVRIDSRRYVDRHPALYQQEMVLNEDATISLVAFPDVNVFVNQLFP